MSNEIDVTILPGWRQAAQDFLQEFRYGDVVPLWWLEARFDIPTLADSQTLTADEFRERQFAWLGAIEAFKAYLLQHHQVMLVSVRGKGYRWVPPHEQTDVAMRDFRHGAQKLFRSASTRLQNLRHLELTDEQRKSSTDATTKLSALRGMVRKALT